MARPGQNSLTATRKCEDQQLARTAGLEVKKTPALSGGTLTQTKGGPPHPSFM